MSALFCFSYTDSYNDNDDRLIQSDKSISLEKMLRNSALSNLLSFIYCLNFMKDIDQRYKLLKLMAQWGKSTRAVINVQRIFRKKVKAMRKLSAEKIRKFVMYWSYKTQRTMKRRSAVLLRKFLTDVQEQAQLNFAIKKFQYKVKKC